MKRAWVEFRPRVSTGFVGSHRRPSGEVGGTADAHSQEAWDPPLLPVPGRGYPRIFVEFDGFVFEFISIVEMLEAASVLERSLVDPVTSQHRWYRKLPASVKANHARGRAASLLRRAAAAYEAQLPDLAKAPGPIPERRGEGVVTRAELRL